MKNESLLFTKPLIVISTIMAIFTFASCSKDSTEDFTIDDIEFAISSNIPNFGAEENLSQTFDLVANLTWELLDATDDPSYEYADWVSSVSPENGKTQSEITITLEPNLTVNPRSTTLYFGLPEYSTYEPLGITITQDGNTSQMSVDRDDIWYMAQSADGSDYTQEINITTLGAWRLYTTADNEEYASADWVTVNTTSGEGSGAISITVDPYDEDQGYRSTYIYIGLDMEGFEPRQIKVSQFAKYNHHISSQDLISTDGVIYVDKSGVVTPSSFRIITSHPWVIAPADDTGESGHYSWVTPSPMSGTNGDQISIACSAYNTLGSRESKLRVGIIVDGTTHYYDSFKIIQEGIDQDTVDDISVNKTEFSFTQTANSANIKVTSDVPWRVMTLDDGDSYDTKWWVTIADKYKSLDGISESDFTFSVVKNGFSQSRSTTFYLVQVGREKPETIEIEISQAADSGSYVKDWGYLGRGYNSMGDYANSTAICDPILDCDKLAALSLVSDFVAIDNTDITVSTSNSISEVQDSLNIAAGLSVEYNGFSAAVESKYSSTSYNYKETKYGSALRNVVKANLRLNTTSFTVEQLRSCMTSTALADIDGALTAKQVVEKYGTHVVLGYTLGGIHEYNVAAITSKSESSSDFSTNVKSGYSAATNSVSGTIDAGVTTDVMKSAYYCEENTSVRGGDGYGDAEAWVASLTPDNVTITNFISPGLFAIADLVLDSDRKSDIEYASTYEAVDITSAAIQGIYQYVFWIGELAYKGSSDALSSSAEGHIEMQCNVPTTSGSSFYNSTWVQKWADYFEGLGLNAVPTYIRENGTFENPTGTNRWVTDAMFIGGAGQEEFGIAIFVDEDDTGGVSDAASGYHYFQSKQNYGGTGDPFMCVYHESAQGLPFFTTSSLNYVSTLWYDGYGQTGATDYYNGEATIHTENGMWYWKLYYRALSDSEMTY